MSRQSRSRAAAWLLLAALAGSAAAQTQLERRRPAQARGSVSIASAFGSIAVHGWDRPEVLVKGTLAAGAEGLSFDGEKGETSVSVEVPEAWLLATREEAAFRTTLEVWVPTASRLSLESVNAAISTAGTTGEVDVSTVNGTVRVEAGSGAVEVETMTGTVEVRSPAAPMSVHTVSGGVRLEGASGEVRVETVSGPVAIRGAGIAKLEVETTTGTVELRGALARRGEASITTFSSPVTVVLPTATKATFDVQTFAGTIRSQFCAGTPLSQRGFEPFRRLQCSTGSEELEIAVRTHDADITLAQETLK